MNLVYVDTSIQPEIMFSFAELKFRIRATKQKFNFQIQFPMHPKFQNQNVRQADRISSENR